MEKMSNGHESAALIDDLVLALEDARRDLEAARVDREGTDDPDLAALISEEIDAISEEIALLEAELESAQEKKSTF